MTSISGPRAVAETVATCGRRVTSMGDGHRRDPAAAAQRLMLLCPSRGVRRRPLPREARRSAPPGFARSGSTRRSPRGLSETGTCAPSILSTTRPRRSPRDRAGVEPGQLGDAQAARVCELEERTVAPAHGRGVLEGDQAHRVVRRERLGQAPNGPGRAYAGARVRAHRVAPGEPVVHPAPAREHTRDANAARDRANARRDEAADVGAGEALGRPLAGERCSSAMSRRIGERVRRKAPLVRSARSNARA